MKINIKVFFLVFATMLSAISCGGNENNTTDTTTDKVEVSLSKINVPALGGSQEVVVTANHEWGTVVSDKWVKVNPVNSTQKQTTITITAETNTQSEPRQAVITFMAGKARTTITVTQEPGSSDLDPNAPVVPAGYKMVWNDEFNSGFELDPAHWTHEVQPSGWVNNELQNYVNGEYNGTRVTEIKDGKLRITCFKEDGKVYSGRVYAHVNQGWLYGYFEARIKLPSGRGTWPAFWMMPANNDFRTNPWPRCGEIDIMEEVGYAPNEVSSSIHCAAYNHSIGTQKTKARTIEKAEGEFHVYACEWTPDYLKFYVDGSLLMTFENDGQNDQNTWPFYVPFYPIFNLAWGGMWGGQKGVDESVLPVTMEVDYIRVFQKK